MSTTTHARLAAVTHLAEGQCLQAAENMQKYEYPVTPTRDRQHFKPE